MDKRKWQDICRKLLLREVERLNHDRGVMLFAEGMFDGKDAILWAFGRNEDLLEVARPLTFEKWYETNGLHRPVSRETMLAAAKQDAFGWLESRDAEKLPVMKQNLRDGGALHGR